MNLKTHTLLLICFIVNSINAQTKDPKLQKLIEFNLINNQQTEVVERVLSETELKFNAIYISAVFFSEFKKLTGFDYTLNTVIDTEKDKLDEEHYKQLNSSFTNYLDKFKSAGIVNEKLVDEMNDRIKNKTYPNLVSFFRDLISKVTFDDWLSMDVSVNLFEALNKNGVIENEKYGQLKADIYTNKLRSPYQILTYCNNAGMVDLSKTDRKPETYLNEIHKLTSAVLPELMYTDFKFEFATETGSFSDPDAIHYVTVSLKSNSKVYKMKSFIELKVTGNNLDQIVKIDIQEYYKIFNKILKDQQSPYRIHLVGSNHDQSEGFDPYQYFGVIALKENQAALFEPNNQILGVTKENYNNEVTSDRINKEIQEFKKMGLFKHLTESQINESLENIEKTNVNSFYELLYNFPDVILSLAYEQEDVGSVYGEIVKMYAQISRKEFNPTAITNNFNQLKSNQYGSL